MSWSVCWCGRPSPLQTPRLITSLFEALNFENQRYGLGYVGSVRDVPGSGWASRARIDVDPKKWRASTQE
jgi:hypothetical protein